MELKRVMVVGGGLAGICASLDLAALHIAVDLVEKAPVLGGHAAQLSCKAVDRCVQCGACLVHQRLALVNAHPRITVHLGVEVCQLEKQERFCATLAATGATPPEPSGPVRLQADALVVATGFDLFDPAAKPYAYGHLANVVTNLELEKSLRACNRLVRPSDGQAPQRLAFVQCVGSRDAAIGHAWCSRFCCAAALRTAAWIKARQPDTQIFFFYIDIQTVGPAADALVSALGDKIRMVRAIPGDIGLGPEGSLRVTYWDPQNRCSACADVDMAVLSAGMRPSAGTAALARLLGVAPVAWEEGRAADGGQRPSGVVWAGAAAGPRTIAQTVASAGAAAWQAARYLGIGG